MRIPAFRSTALAIPVLLAACGEHSPSAPLTAAQRTVASEVSLGPIWRDAVEGVTANGAKFGLYVPQNWNGDLVTYAHGFVIPGAPVDLPTDDNAVPIRDGLGTLGYAVATSSYSENGYAVQDGIQRTHQLRGLFTSRFGKPLRSFLIGQSLGGQIVQALVETHAPQYDGALALCGVLGGTKLQTDYVGHIRTVFDFFYPGVLPGTTLEMPAITDLNAQIIFPAFVAIQTNPNGFGAIARIDQTALAGRNAGEQVNTLLNALVYQALGANDLMGRTHGHTLFDNTTTVYSSSALPPPLVAALNASVARYEATPDAEQWLEHNYQPTGDLRIPMLTVHKRWDRLVPFRHEAAYQQIVAAAGNSGLLRQRTVDDYGHCEFGAPATIANFQDLVTWVTTGTPPAP